MRQFLKSCIFFVSFISCLNESKKTFTASNESPSVNLISQISAAERIPERVLLVTAKTMSVFGSDAGAAQQVLPDTTRNGAFSIHDSNALNSLEAEAKLLSQKVSELAEIQPPRGSGASSFFDWYVLVSTAIVGNIEPDPNFREVLVKITLRQLVETHNKGFQVLIKNSENKEDFANLAPATRNDFIDESKLDAGQLRYIRDFSFRQDSGTELFLPGKVGAEVARDFSGEPVKVIVRFCPGSTLRCIEQLRQSEIASAHYLSYKGRNGKRELIGFHDIGKDLRWFAQNQSQSVVLMVDGFPGLLPETNRPNWIDWEDYVDISASAISLLRQASRNISGIDDKLKDAEFIKNHIIQEFENSETSGQKSFSQFLLPLVWDKSIFDELLLKQSISKQTSSIGIERPLNGSRLQGTSLNFSIFPEAETSEILLYRDKKSAVNSWELFLREEVRDARASFSETQEFRSRGIAGGKTRWIKVENRGANGEIISSKIVSFLLNGIP
jgi:hypothetical protein